ncbi:hypothetical protein D3C81_2221570 [compost metagenome]
MFAPCCRGYGQHVNIQQITVQHKVDKPQRIALIVRAGYKSNTLAQAAGQIFSDLIDDGLRQMRQRDELFFN